MSNASIIIGPDPISVDALLKFVSREDCGAVSLFLGTVRNENEGTPVSRITYTAFREMAEKECRRIVDDAFRKWPIQRVALQHRLGSLVPPEPSVAIAVASPHRAEAFEACRYIIEELKKTAPIWKEEFTPDGKRWINPVRES